MKMIMRIMLAAAVAMPVVLAGQQPAATSFAIVHANAVDVRTGAITPDATIVVRDGKIASVGPGAAPPGLRVVDARGLHVLPGLIDAHTHISNLAPRARRSSRA